MSRSFVEAHHVTVAGDITSNRVVVLSHGFGSDQSSWRLIVPQLPKGLKIVLLDLAFVGSKNSRKFDYNRYNSLEEFASDLLSILDELQIKTCVYVGHSMSGMIGCIAAIRRPALFEKLILLGASPRYLNDGHSYFGGFEEEDVMQLFAAMEQNFPMWATTFAPLVVGADFPAAVEEFSRTLQGIQAGVAVHVAKLIFLGDYRSILPAVTVPCHVIQTKNDFAVPGNVAEYLHRRVGGHSTLDILETEGHLPHITAPTILAPILLKSIRDQMCLI